MRTSRSIHRVLPVAILIGLVWGSSIAGTAPPVQAQTLPVVKAMNYPLGFRDGNLYAPHKVITANGTLIEDTNYGIKNPSMHGSTCFGIDWSQIYHAGADLYRIDGASTYMAEVSAVADGQVVYATAIRYPGTVIITKHLLPNGSILYSMYGHMDNAINVSNGQMVTRGQRLGRVMFQIYNNVDDSHLHWEMRYFYDGSNIYPPQYSSCNGIVPARGYTYPSLPDFFPSYASGYREPISSVRRYSPAFVPSLFGSP